MVCLVVKNVTAKSAQAQENWTNGIVCPLDTEAGL